MFTNLLAHADKMGQVDIHPRAIAEEVGLSVDQVRAALDELESPDPESRSPEEEGRRIIRLDEHRAWGWHVVNYIKYRDIKSEDERREQNRLAQERWREKNKQRNQPSAPVSKAKRQSASAKALSAESAHTDVALALALDSDAKKGQKPSTGASLPAAPTAETWAAYSEAYESAYSVKPVRNAQVNGQLSQLVARLGAAEAPEVARWFLRHRNGLYVSAMHSVNLLLRDAEKLRTEWATGRQVTRTQAQQQDRTQTNANAFSKILAEAQRQEIENAKP